MKRTFDFSWALLALIILLPFFLIIGLLIKADSRGSVFYKQIRVGKNKRNFKLFKFRTMYMRPANQSQLTIGARDPRITKIGYWLRKYKIDELPQLVNVLLGEMSFVGPRPELNKYVNFYNLEQQRVLTVKPGITDWASIEYCNESELLAAAKDPERFYINEVIPTKISHSLQYIDNHDMWIDLKIIFLTFRRIVKN